MISIDIWYILTDSDIPMRSSGMQPLSTIIKPLTPRFHTESLVCFAHPSMKLPKPIAEIPFKAGAWCFNILVMLPILSIATTNTGTSLKVSERHAQGMHMYKDDQGCVQTTWDDPIRGCKLFVRLCGLEVPANPLQWNVSSWQQSQPDSCIYTYQLLQTKAHRCCRVYREIKYILHTYIVYSTWTLCI